MSSNRKVLPSVTNTSKLRKTKPIDLGMAGKAMAALVTFGGMFGNSGMFSPKTLVKKDCLNCGTTHHHNAYCSVYCCHSWRLANPHRGRANHFFGEYGHVCRVESASFSGTSWVQRV